LLLASVAQAELKFEQTVIEGVIPPDVKSYPFAFPFTNEGTSAVEISEIKTTCGCTTAKLEKMVYAPGESGIIKGAFSLGDRKGLQQKSITVLTTDLGQPSIKLALSLEIPQLVTIKPGLLLWRVGTELKAKKLTVMPNKDLGVNILSIEVDEGPFAIQLSESPNPDGSHEVIINPQELGSQIRSLIRIKVALKDSPGETSTFFAHAIIR